MRYLSVVALALLSGCTSIAVGHVVGGEAGSSGEAGATAAAGSSGSVAATGGQPAAGSSGTAGAPTAGAAAQGGAGGSGGAADGCNGPNEYFNATTGHCYWYNADHLSFTDAEGVCVGWGGTLASMTSDEERSFLYTANISAPATWIGLTATAANQPYTWLTGEPLDYINWQAGEPNYDTAVGPTQLCGAMRQVSWSPPYAWEDTYCAYANPSLCEKVL